MRFFSSMLTADLIRTHSLPVSFYFATNKCGNESINNELIFIIGR